MEVFMCLCFSVCPAVHISVLMCVFKRVPAVCVRFAMSPFEALLRAVASAPRLMMIFP